VPNRLLRVHRKNYRLSRFVNLLIQTSKFDKNNLKEAESINRASFLSEDLKEGQLAFLEKRGPLFKCR
jgi:hypothetical protein